MTKNDKALVSPWDPALALVLLTRLPLPTLPDHAFTRQARAAWAWPLAGLVAGGMAWAAGASLLALGLPPMPAAGVMLALLIMTTGAMHEDGLADTADGLWGGFTRERRLEIMRDSRIGSYGVLALIVMQGLRWSAIAGLAASGGLGTVLAAALWSRALMAGLMATLPQARSDGLSRSVGRPFVLTALLACACALIGAWFTGTPLILPAFLALAGVAALGALAHARIGGQTGDILGAAQQIAETLFLLTALALL
ncbi:adenosylcobinamide-GDP ribazoletransferase [Lutimaribacter marinistellae]|uniref:Adenosylcobinamide-GDP ribazoletransferase n=1 Tax=Lutimaribacter marinistellae TaxID=1820329 RepID=A0ABV7TK41_9RHOB